MKKLEKTLKTTQIVFYIAFIILMLVTVKLFYTAETAASSFAYEQIQQTKDYIYLCDPHYDGKSYSQEPCNILSINITGNYCDGVQVCGNTLRNSLI